MQNDKCKKRLLIVDDDDILQVYLKKFFSKHGYHVTFLSYGENLPNVLEKQSQSIGLIVLDVLLPGKDGFYWLNWLRQYHPNIPVIMASVQVSEDDRLRGLESGALDYLVKPFHNKELLIRISNVLQYHTLLQQPTMRSPQVIKIGSIKLDTKNNSVSKETGTTQLTQMEANILKFLYLNAGTVLSRDQIMEQIRGVKHNPLDRSIDIHINKIRKKIEDNPAHPFFIRTIRGKGYCLQLPSFGS